MKRSPIFVIALAACGSLLLFAQQDSFRREDNFKRADKNGDGKISPEEFSRNPEGFASFDKNKDGFVTREEFGLAPESGRQVYTQEERRLMAGDGAGPVSGNVSGIDIPLDAAPIKEIRAPVRDGRIAEASYRMPPGNGPFPAIIFIHGGLSFTGQEQRQRNLTSGATQTRFLSMGFVTVQSTFRSYAQNPQDEGPVLDNLAILEAVRKLDKVDRESIVIMGGSGGGSITLDLDSRTTFCAAIAGEPASIIFAGMLTKPSEEREARYEPIYDPKKFYTAEIERKVRDKIRRFQTPLLILHGDVHPLKKVNMEYIVPEIQKAGKTVTVKVFPGKDHGFYWGQKLDQADFDRMMQEIRAFVLPLLKTKPMALNQG